MSGVEIIRSILELLPAGFGFHPSDQQSIQYLTWKIRGMDSELKMKITRNGPKVDIIPEVEVCKWEPWELPAKLNHPVFSVIQIDEPEWLFFTSLQRKHPNGRQFKRDTKDGFWKPTGRDRQIKDPATKEVIGRKKTLVFHRGRGPRAARTPWVIHEYHSVTASLPANKTYVLCRLKTEAGFGFPPETNSNGMLHELPFIQANSLMKMEVGNSYTGTGILQNGAANIMSLGASNIASDTINNQLDDMTSQACALPSGPQLNHMTSQDYALADRPRSPFDSDDFLYRVKCIFEFRGLSPPQIE